MVKLVSGAVAMFSMGRLPRRRLESKGARGTRRGCDLVKSIGVLVRGGCCLMVLMMSVLHRACSTVVGVKVFCVACMLKGTTLLKAFSNTVGLTLVMKLTFLPSLITGFGKCCGLGFSKCLMTTTKHKVIVITNCVNGMPLVLTNATVNTVNVTP